MTRRLCRSTCCKVRTPTQEYTHIHLPVHTHTQHTHQSTHTHLSSLSLAIRQSLPALHAFFISQHFCFRLRSKGEPERGSGRRQWGGVRLSVFCSVMANETHKQFIKRELSQKRKNDKAKMPQRLSQSAIPHSLPAPSPLGLPPGTASECPGRQRQRQRQRVTLAVRKADMDCG